MAKTKATLGNEIEAELRTEHQRYGLAKAVEALRVQAARAFALSTTLEQYAADLLAEKDIDRVSLDTRYCWAINEIENYMRNLNFSNLARHAGNLHGE